jgi:hypothetical protein
LKIRLLKYSSEVKKRNKGGKQEGSEKRKEEIIQKSRK